MRIHVEFMQGAGAVDIYAPIEVVETGHDPPTGVACLPREFFPYDLEVVSAVTLTDLSRPNFPVKWRCDRATTNGAEVVFELEMSA